MSQHGNSLIETHGIDVIPLSERYGSPVSLGTFWFGTQLSASNLLLGALGPALGLDFRTSVLVILLANVAGAIMTAYATTIGPLTGQSQIESGAAAFGRCNRVPALLLWLTTVGWGGLNSLFGIVAISLLLGIPLGWGVLACFVCQATLSVMGYEALHKFAKMLSVVMALLFAVLTWRIVSQFGTTASPSTTVEGWPRFSNIIIVFMAQMSAVMTWAPFGSDFSRYLPPTTRRSAVFGWTFLGSSLSALWVELLGLGVSGMVINAGITGAPAAMETLMGGANFAGQITLLAVFLNSLATSAIDYYTGGLSLQTAGVRLSRPIVVLLMGVLTFFVSLWFLYGSNDLLNRSQNFLLLVGYWVSPWFAIILIDWQSRIRHLTMSGPAPISVMHGGGGALGALALGFLAALPFSRTSIGDAVAAAHPGSPLEWVLGGLSRLALHGADFGFVSGFVVASLAYLAILRSRQPVTALTDYSGIS